MLFPVDHHAKTYPWLDAVKDWMEQGADCSGTSAASLISQLPIGFSGRTSLALCPQTTEPTSLPCCGDSPAHTPGCPMEDGVPQAWWSDPNGGLSGGCLTLDISEWPNDAAVCSLSQVLEAAVDPSYFLSPRAIEGIVRRISQAMGQSDFTASKANTIGPSLTQRHQSLSDPDSASQRLLQLLTHYHDRED